MLKRQMLTWAAAAVALATATTTVHADDIFWQGGTGAIDAANYYKPSTGEINLVPPTSGDFEDIGNGTVTLSDPQALTMARIRIGHNFTDGGTIAPAGPATFNVTGGSLTVAGTTVKATENDTQGTQGGLIIGYNESGAVNISGGSVTVGRYVSVGLDNTNDAIDNVPGATATLNISGTGALAITHATNLSSTVFVGNGVPGSVTISDSGSLVATSNKVDLQVGTVSSGTFTQTGGNTSMSSSITVGGGTVAGALMSVSGGTVAGSALNVGTDNASGATLTVTGSSAVSLTGGIIAGTNASTNTTVTFSGSAQVTAAGAITMGTSGGSGTVWNIADNASVSAGTAGRNSTADNIYFGRSGNATLNMTGGTLSVAQYFLTGTSASGSTAPNNVVNQSAGTITSGSNFVINDSAVGDSTYNLSGTGTIHSGGRLIVGRQKGVAVMNQTGGSVTAAVGVQIADAQSTADPSLYATGTYNVSGGTLNASVPTGSTVNALAIAPAGTGTFHVIGSDATVTVTGNMLVNYLPAVDPYPAAVGTLAYTLEPGESLTEINVTGTATFATGSVLSLDLAGLTPSQSSFDLLTAADIVDNGLTFSAPTGWNFQIVSGGNGEVLQAFSMATVHNPGDTNNDGVVDLTDLNNVLNNFGSTGAGNPGDDDSSGVVDLTDLNNVLNNFGTTYAAAALNVVPEPASLSLLGLGAAALLGRRRRR